MNRPKSTTATFILELPLVVDTHQARILHAHFEAGRNLYNTLLGEANRRLARLRNSTEWKAACAIPKTSKTERKAAFAKAVETYGFSEYALHHYATQARTSWIREHIDANTAQKLATRAFFAANKVAKGQARRVRFRSKGRGLDSLEGKNNTTGIRFLVDKPHLGNSGRVVWGKLELPAIIDWQDEVVRHGLKCRVKYVRLIKRKATSLHSRGADHWGFRYYAQLILEGQPYLKPKNQPGSLTIGLDIGPQTIAIVSQQGEVARLEQFCSELEPKAARKRRLQRKLDRQRRAGNPANFDEKGRVKKKAEGGGKLSWQESQGYKQTRRKLANADRSVAAQRKSLHGRLANEIARDSNIILTEKLSYKAFQKQYGRSVGLRAPGRFIEKMRRTVERTAGTCLEFPTRTTRLSQVCHHCGTLAKKKLSQRWHKCECGIGPIQRDVYSAWLASHVSPIEQTLSSAQCLAHWERAEPRLVAALDSLYQQAKEGKTFPRSVGLSTRARAC